MLSLTQFKFSLCLGTKTWLYATAGQGHWRSSRPRPLLFVLLVYSFGLCLGPDFPVYVVYLLYQVDSSQGQLLHLSSTSLLKLTFLLPKTNGFVVLCNIQNVLNNVSHLTLNVTQTGVCLFLAEFYRCKS